MRRDILKTKTGDTAHARAFTLVEVLAVTAIIAVLVAILLPIISKARTYANLVVCKSNLRQIGNALLMYAGDNQDHFPDAYSLGGAFFRRGPGERNPADPSSVPEVYGLPALMARYRYLPSNATALWTCPAAAEWMKSYKNTYVWQLLWGSQDALTTFTRGRPKRADNFFVYDNYTNLPYFTGARRGMTDPNPTLSPKQYVMPHAYLTAIYSSTANPNARRGAINALYLNGSVGTVVYLTDPTNPSGPPRALALHGE